MRTVQLCMSRFAPEAMRRNPAWGLARLVPIRETHCPGVASASSGVTSRPLRTLGWEGPYGGSLRDCGSLTIENSLG